MVDGVFSRDRGGALQFTAASPPTALEMSVMVRAIARRVSKRLARTSARDAPIDGALARCAQLALFRGDVRKIAQGASSEGEEPEPPPSAGSAVDCDGYNLEASVRIAADDDFGREHLLRYGARPSLALGRLRLLAGGKVAYRIKRLRGGQEKVRILTPIELLARLAALVPPPRHPLVRFHGVFAARSSWRRDVVPKPRPEAANPPTAPSANHRDDDEPRSKPRRLATPPSAAGLAPRTEALSPNVIAVHHWDRLHAGALLAASPRIDWASLLRRTFGVDALECPKCASRIRILNVVDDEATAKSILDELGVDTAPSPRARDPSVPIASDEPSYDALS